MSKEVGAGPSNEETNSSSNHEDSIVLSDTFFANPNPDSEGTKEVSDCGYVE